MLFAQHEPAGLDALMQVVFYVMVTSVGVLILGCCVIPSMVIKNVVQDFCLRNFHVKFTGWQIVMFSAVLLFVLITPWVASVFSDQRPTVGSSVLPRFMAQVFMVDGIVFWGISLVAANSRGFLSWKVNLTLVLVFAAFLLVSEMLIFAITLPDPAASAL